MSWTRVPARHARADLDTHELGVDAQAVVGGGEHGRQQLRGRPHPLGAQRLDHQRPVCHLHLCAQRRSLSIALWTSSAYGLFGAHVRDPTGSLKPQRTCDSRCGGRLRRDGQTDCTGVANLFTEVQHGHPDVILRRRSSTHASVAAFARPSGIQQASIC